MEERAGLAKRLPLIFFVLTFCLYGYLIFSFFSPEQFHKYALAATQALNDTLPKDRFLDFSPLYLSFHILVRKFLKQPDLFLKLVQIVCASLSATILYLLLKRFARLPIALIGTAALILNPTMIVLTQAYEPEVLAFFFTIGFLYFAVRDSRASPFLSGVLAGLAFLTRPNLLPVLLFVPIYFIFTPSLGRTRRPVSVIGFMLPVILSISFLLVRNGRLAGRTTLLAMNPGTVFYEGNNPHSWGITSMYPFLVYDLGRQYPRTPDVQHELYRRLARLSEGKNLSVAEVNKFWLSKAGRFIRDHPHRYLRVLAHKMLHLFHSYDWHDLYNSYWNQKRLSHSAFPVVAWGFISALAMLGLIVQAPRWRESLLFYALFLCQTGTILTFYVSSRQRIMLLPAFIFFACTSLEFMTSKRRRWGVLAAVIPISVILFIPSDLMREEDHLWESVRTSNECLSGAYRARKAMAYPEAEKQAAHALAEAPWLIESVRPSDLCFEPAGFPETALSFQRPASPSDKFDRAFLLLLAGKHGAAEAEWRALLAERRKWKRDYYQSSSPEYYIAIAALQAGDLDMAKNSLLTGLETSPGDPSILALLTALTEDDRYSGRIFRYYDEVSARYYLGKAYLLAGKADLAVEQFAYVSGRLPDYRASQVYLAVAEGTAGDQTSAASLYIDVVTKQPDPVLLEKEVIELFQTRSEQSGHDPRVFLESGIVLRQFGHFQDALAALERAKELGKGEWAEGVQLEIETIGRLLRAHR